MAEDPQPSDENRCIECKSELPAPGATKCTKCGSWQEKDYRCSTCRRTIPRNADFCNECKSYQKGLRSYFNVSSTFLSLITALFAVMSIIVTQGSAVFDRHSQTEFKVTGANDLLVHLKVWNNGREPSTLLGYELMFGVLPIKKMALFPKDAQEGRIIILPGKPVEVVLEPYAKLTTTCRVAYDQPCRREELLKKLGSASVTLEMEVEESGHFWNLISTHPFRHTQRDTFSGNIIYQFMEKTP